MQTTGDIGNINEYGVIRLTGREKYEINRARLKFNPEDLDMILEDHPDISEVCTFALPDPISRETVGVAVTLINGKTINTNMLDKWCRKFLPREKIPDRWFVLEQIPRSGFGKVNRKIVADICVTQYQIL